MRVQSIHQRMKRFLLWVLPWMVTLAQADPSAWKPASVSFTYFGTTSEGVWRDGDACYVSLSRLAAWGWAYRLEESSANIIAEGRQVRVPVKASPYGSLLPLKDALGKLGGVGLWKPGSDVFEVRSRVDRIKVFEDQLLVEATLSAAPKLSTLENPDRLVLDLEGAALSSLAKLELPPNARASQYSPNVVRVVIETSQTPLIKSIHKSPTRSFDLRLGEPTANPAAADNIAVPQPPAQEPKTTPNPVASPTPTTDPLPWEPHQDPSQTGRQEPNSLVNTIIQPVTVGPISITKETDSGVILRLPITSPLVGPPTFTRPDPNTLEIRLPGSKYVQDSIPKLPNPLIETVSVREINADTVLTLKLARPLGLEVAPSASEVVLSLIKPAVGNGKLAGKVVVVDAGHGAHDSGARSRNGQVLEKNLNLAIARRVSEALTSEGVTVIMTRKSDVFIPLKERADIANRNKADFFISVHINSNTSGSTSGGITFYHLQDPIGRLLADCIQAEIAKGSGIPSIGTWSDGRIYDTGFAVLRHSTMPAVLIECGFINHPRDVARMVQDDFHRAIARGVVMGLKVYLGEIKR